MLLSRIWRSGCVIYSYMQPATVVRMFYKRHRVSRIPGTEKPVDNLFMFELFSKCRRFPTTVVRSFKWIYFKTFSFSNK